MGRGKLLNCHSWNRILVGGFFFGEAYQAELWFSFFQSQREINFAGNEIIDPRVFFIFIIIVKVHFAIIGSRLKNELKFLIKEKLIKLEIWSFRDNEIKICAINIYEKINIAASLEFFPREFSIS